jgi:hypothetical protein
MMEKYKFESDRKFKILVAFMMHPKWGERKQDVCENVVTLETSLAATCDRVLQSGHQPLQLNFHSKSYNATYIGE